MFSAVRLTLLVLFVVVTTVELGLWFWARKTFALPGAVPVRITWRQAEVYFNPHGKLPPWLNDGMLWGDRNSPDRERIRLETQSVVTGLTDPLDRAVALRRWVRSQCRKLGPDIERNSIQEPPAILDAMRAGMGAQCGPLAFLLREAYAANDIPSRVMLAFRNPPFPSDAHAAVEAYIHGRWVLMDPTFDAHWKIGNKLASAWDLRQEHFFYRKTPIEVIYGSRPFLPNLDTYGLNYYIHLDNIVYQFYRDPYVKRWNLQRYPYTKLLQGNFVQIVTPPGHFSVDVSPFRLYNQMVWLLYVWLPTLWLVLAIGIALTFLHRRAR